MRHVLFLGLTACASTLPAASETAASTQPPAEEAAPPADERTTQARGLRADELLEAAGVATFLEDHELHVAAVDEAAIERWLSRKPSAVFLYTERSLEIAEGASLRGECQRVAVWDDVVVNQLSIVVSRHGDERVVVDLGQESVSVVEQRLEQRRWQASGVRRLPVGVIAWDDAHVAYAEGAEIHELACVPTLRPVPCVEDRWDGPRGHCVDHALVVRPWRAPTVLHVGGVIPGHRDPIPEIPSEECEVTCAPSACDEALRTAHLPRAPLYAEQDPVLAVFRTQTACRAFVASRGPRTPDAATW
ncbi:hypothetical protein [Sandaracinus amylolyticus]|uniref:Lipoprotein n=1 Tax=Sandaracinus amylolyticus TaxID=927083 RepID=A0A0F6YHB6_9BACT|nr:hypothetical protein [Sandaracinus amylolyticus]AKF05720.1 hypothetical protein DB32_002869 [Sandaracinus amylolyticus]